MERQKERLETKCTQLGIVLYAVVSCCAAPSLQMLILVPEMYHPAYGTVRVMVKDSTDPSGEASLVYLDSDGSINSDSNRTAAWPESFVGEPWEGCTHVDALRTPAEQPEFADKKKHK